MKNTLSDLNNYLFEMLENIMDPDNDAEELEKTIEKSEAVTKVAEVIIRNGELALKTMKHMDEYGLERGLTKLPPMLDTPRREF